MKTNPFHRFISFDISALFTKTYGEFAAAFETTETYRRKQDEPLFCQPESLTNLRALACAAGYNSELLAQPIHNILATWPAKDPSAGQYASMGFTAPDDTVIDEESGEPSMCCFIQGRAQVVLNIQHRERILPAKIISEKLQDRVKEFEQREGRPANKKDWAILKDEVRASMLQTALVRRTDIPVILGKGYCHIFTSSAKRAEDINAYMRTVFGTWPVIRVFADPMAVSNWMHKVTGAHKECDDVGSFTSQFIPGHYAKMEDPRDDSVITVKNELAKNADGYTVGELSDRGYLPTEMDVVFCPEGVDLDDENDQLKPEGEFNLVLRISNKGVVKKFSFGDISEDAMTQRVGYHDDTPYASKVWVVAVEIERLFDALRKDKVILDDDEKSAEEPEDKGQVDITLMQGGVVFSNGETTVTIELMPDPLDDDDIVDALADEPEEDDEL